MLAKRASEDIEDIASAGEFTDRTVVDRMVRWAREQSDKPAFTFLVNDGAAEQPPSISYAEFAEDVAAMAERLSAVTNPGDRVLLLLPPGISYVVAFMACLQCGAIAVTLYAPATDREWSRVLFAAKDCEPVAAIAPPDAVAMISRLPDIRHWIATPHAECAAARSRAAIASPIQRTGDDIAFIQYTSGSTGNPKGVVVTHANLVANARALAEAVGNDRDTVHVSFLPLYHDMGLIGMVIQSLYVGGHAVLMAPYRFMRRPLSWLQAISDYRATTAGAPNFAYDLCVARAKDGDLSELDLSCWKVAYNGSEPVRISTMERFASRFAAAGFAADAFVPSYGLAEATLFVSGSRGGIRSLTLDRGALAQGRVVAADGGDGSTRIAASGSPLGQVVRIVDPVHWRTCPTGRIGEIWLKGDSVARGYWNNPAETANIFRGYAIDTGEGPFLRTGDLGFVHDGQLYVTGRIKELIIVNGANHYPQDIEATVQSLSGAFRHGSGAAFADDDGRLAIVQGLHNLDLGQSELDELIALVRQRVWRDHSIPPSLIALVKPGEISKTGSGKIQRSTIRRRLADGTMPLVAAWRSPAVALPEPTPGPTPPEGRGRSSATAGSSRHTVLRYIRAWVAERTEVTMNAASDDIEFAAFGLGSIEAVELSAALSDRYDSDFEPALFFNYPTISALSQYVETQISSTTEEPDAVRVNRSR